MVEFNGINSGSRIVIATTHKRAASPISYAGGHGPEDLSGQGLSRDSPGSASCNGC